MTETIIKTVILIPPMLLIMICISIVFDYLNKLLFSMVKKFYSTKIGYYFEKYKLFERILFGVFALLLMYGCAAMGREMIAYYRR